MRYLTQTRFSCFRKSFHTFFAATIVHNFRILFSYLLFNDLIRESSKLSISSFPSIISNLRSSRLESRDSIESRFSGDETFRLSSLNLGWQFFKRRVPTLLNSFWVRQFVRRFVRPMDFTMVSVWMNFSLFASSFQVRSSRG